MSTLLPRWRQISFSITATGTVPIKNVGTDPKAIRGPGFISFQRGCPLPCYICHPIIAMCRPDTSVSHMDNLKRTGGHGREKNTGISTSPDMRERNGMIWKKGNMNKVEAKENTAIRSLEKI
jgi:hypothetical protein